MWPRPRSRPGFGSVKACSRLRGDLRQAAVQADRVAERLDDAEDPGLAVERLGLLPGRVRLAHQVEQEQAVVGHRGEQSAWLCGGFQNPGLLTNSQPCMTQTASGSASRIAPSTAAAHAGQKRRVAARRRHLDERVRRVQMVGAELPRLLLDERLADLPEQRVERDREIACPGNPPSSGAGGSWAWGNLSLSAAGTWPVKPCSTGVMPSSRSRARIFFCELAVAVDPRCGSGPPQPSMQPIQPNGR